MGVFETTASHKLDVSTARVLKHYRFEKLTGPGNEKHARRPNARLGYYRCTVTVGTFEARSRSLVLLPRSKLFKGERL